MGGRPGQARGGSALAVVHLNGGGEHVHIQAAVVTDGNAGQGAAILEGAGLDVAHALGDGDIGEGSAAVEGTGLDVLHAVSDVHGGQVGAALEGDGTDAGDSAFHFHIGDLVGLVCPGCRAVGGKVGHTAGAADGQGAVGQGPGDALAAGVVAGGSSGCSGTEIYFFSRFFSCTGSLVVMKSTLRSISHFMSSVLFTVQAFTFMPKSWHS